MRVLKIKKGENRIVLILPLIRLVIKVPIIHLVNAIQILLYDLKHGSLRKSFKYTTEQYGTWQRFLFRGIIDNWSEFQFYRKTRHPFTQPTLISFFGLLNIQRMGSSCSIDSIDLWCQLYELTGGEVFRDSHHFNNPDNFCLENGKLGMLDYGNIRVQSVITDFGEQILERFDPAYSWEERKKQLRVEKEST